ncbi:MAG: hypothetical protein LBS69_08230 [Prevotellaceae bacterium]|jgi:hypothetical protein|nr:hypothetical protein [Prevotellaceae bacterium]
MKKILLKTTAILLLLAGVISCGEDKDEVNSLKGTKWKLIEFVKVSEGTTKIPEPQSDQCYWIIFDSNTTLSGYSSNNGLFGYYQINTQTSTMRINSLSGTKRGELFDGYFYLDCLSIVNYFELTETSLKLYYSETDYLLFKII